MKPFINLHVWIHYQLRLNLSVNFFLKFFVNSLRTFNKPNELKRLLIIVDLSQFFKRFMVEKDLSGVQDVSELSINKLQRTTTFEIKFFSAFPISFIFLAYFSKPHYINISQYYSRHIHFNWFIFILIITICFPYIFNKFFINNSLIL